MRSLNRMNKALKKSIKPIKEKPVHVQVKVPKEVAEKAKEQLDKYNSNFQRYLLQCVEELIK